MSLLESYERLLWGMMDALGISHSVARKVLAAVGIQFGISVAQAGLPWVTSGRTTTVLSVLLLIGAAVAFLNTVLIVRRDVVDPIDQLSASASAVAAGDLSTSPPTTDGNDEIAELVEDFGDMHEHLRLVSAQATAMADREFDDPVLDERLPGEFGDSLGRMATDLTTHTRALQRLVDAFGEATEHAREGDLTALMPAEELAEEDERYGEVARSYNEFLRTLSATIRARRSSRYSNSISAACAAPTAGVSRLAIDERMLFDRDFLDVRRALLQQDAVAAVRTADAAVLVQFDVSLAPGTRVAH